MTKEQKKLEVKAILDNLQRVIDNGIDIEMDGNLVAYELVYQALTVSIQMCLEAAIQSIDPEDQTLTQQSAVELINKFMLEAKHEKNINKDEVNEIIKKIEKIAKEEPLVTPTTNVGSKYDN